MASPHPVIVCGKVPEVARIVISAIKPEMEVIHFCDNVEDAIKEIPAILRGEAPTSKPKLGPVFVTGDYSKKPVAVLTGGLFSDNVPDMMKAAEGGHAVTWLLPDKSKNTNPPDPVEPFSLEIAQRVKKLVLRLESEGTLGQRKAEMF